MAVYGDAMRHRSALMVVSVLALAMTGCTAPGAVTGGAAGPADSPAPDVAPQTSESTAADVATGSSDAQAQAHAWLDSAVLPPGAVRADASVATFSSYTGWPCGPYAELQAFWSIPGSTVSETANWLRANPTGALLPTGVGPVPDQAFQSATVGNIPTERAQEGIVYTVEKTSDGVAVRAEVAAQTVAAFCPDIPDGGVYGAPGEG